MDKIVRIYCEGKAGSHDFDIIEKAISGLPVEIIPIGSKRCAGSAIELHEGLVSKSDHYIFFRDRDFDKEVPERPALIQETHHCFSYRTTIENYLFSPDTFYNFVVYKGLSERYKLTKPDHVKSVFIQAAKTIAHYQAIRHAMGKMRVSTDFGTTWIKNGSGVLPSPEELDNHALCREKAFQKILEGKSNTESWTEAEFNQLVDGFYAKFSTNAFYENAEYLIWFQGKDFARALGWRLNAFPLNLYYKYAKNKFNYLWFEDFVDLRQTVQNLLKHS